MLVCVSSVSPSSPAALPPSYDDVVATVAPAGSGEPSAPPQSHVAAAATPLMTHHSQPGYNSRDPLQEEDHSRRGMMGGRGGERESEGDPVISELSHSLHVHVYGGGATFCGELHRPMVVKSGRSE